jgi:hypothetical protein
MVQSLGTLVYCGGENLVNAQKTAVEMALKNPGTTYVITRAVGHVTIDKDGVIDLKFYRNVPAQ